MCLWTVRQGDEVPYLPRMTSQARSGWFTGRAGGIAQLQPREWHDHLSTSDLATLVSVMWRDHLSTSDLVSNVSVCHVA